MDNNMKKYKVVAEFSHYAHLIIEAESKDKAEEIAKNTDGGDFYTDEHSGDMEIMYHMTTEIKEESNDS